MTKNARKLNSQLSACNTIYFVAVKLRGGVTMAGCSTTMHKHISQPFILSNDFINM